MSFVEASWKRQEESRSVKRIRFWFSQAGAAELPPFFDRQVRAFGPDIQRLLSRLRVGIVGVGGTGSCVLEQLIRLGVGTLIISDGEAFESSNVNRVYGSRVVDDTIAKIKIAQRLAADIGLGTKLELIDKPISYQSALKNFRNCDIIMGCTDDELGRSLLNTFAIYYYVPVFDMGVKIDSEDGVIRSIQGRVTTLMNGAACLHCRGRISAERIAAQAKWEADPEGAQALEDEGYLPELGDPAPAVVAFTTAIAASAVTEVLHRLTGFMGAGRESTEVLHLIDQTSVRTNKLAPQHDCFCADSYNWGRGDVRPFLERADPVVPFVNIERGENLREACCRFREFRAGLRKAVQQRQGERQPRAGLHLFDGIEGRLDASDRRPERGSHVICCGYRRPVPFCNTRHVPPRSTLAPASE